MKSADGNEGKAEADRDSVDSLMDALESEYDPELARQDEALRRNSLPVKPPLSTVAEESIDPFPPNPYLCNRLKAAKRESNGTWAFLQAALNILLSTNAFTIILVLYLAMPVSMIVMGIVYFDDCPAEKLIINYLLMYGCFSGAKSIFGLVYRYRQIKYRYELGNNAKRILQIVDCFIFGMFIGGCIIVYRTKDNFVTDNPDDPNYCNETLYWFSFWSITSGFIGLCAILLIGLWLAVW